MQTLGKIAVFVLFAVVFVLCAASEVFAAEVQNIRLGNQNGASARLVLDLTDHPSHEVLLLKNPYRVVIDLEKTTIVVPENKIPKTSNIVRDLRIGKTPKGAARIVVETKDSAIVKKAFFLPPQGGFDWRLVVDITSASQDDFEKAKAQNPKPQTATPTQTEISAKDAAAELEKLKKPLAAKPLIVLDPGHGGKDPGAISASGYYEKHITLKMAKELKQTLEATGKYRVMLTRSDDRALALKSRVKIARDARADLFISIHADSAKNSRAKGLSVYTLSERASDRESAALAERENKVDALINMDFSDKTPEVANILIDLARRDTMNTSKDLANYMVSEMSRTVRVLPDTHRFAGFAVLKAQDIPSVLVEIGYLSNREEERLIRSPAYREKLAKALTKAIDKFFESRSIVED